MFSKMSEIYLSQIREIAIGMEASGQRFLWVVRESNLNALLPYSFLRQTKDTCLVITSWAPQCEVLEHDVVGCFLTHCG